MPSILFVHENYPAQFGILAGVLAKQGWQVVYATQKETLPADTSRRLDSGVHLIRYSRAREPRDDTHPYLRGTETAVLNGQGFARTAVGLSKSGFTPDIIVAHSGWGSGSFAKVVWPQAKFVQYLEWWYRYPPVDVDPATLDPKTAEDRHARTLARNLPFMLDFQQSDLIIAPTQFQADQMPDFVQSKLVVQHDGVDCDMFRPAAPDDTAFDHPNLPQDAKIVTFATRGMEPARGFPTFMEAAARILKQRADIHIVIAGGEKSHYGPAPKDHDSWKAKALAEHDFDMTRLHFTGLLRKDLYAQVLRRSSAHVYLTQPFVLSWSFIEAMASAAPLICSDVPPVIEAIGDDTCARIGPGANPDRVYADIVWCLDNPEAAQAMGARARDRAVERFSSSICHTALKQHFEKMIVHRP
ncbi:MAG: glycosyltransferase [Paracoccaceae bacterium]